MPILLHKSKAVTNDLSTEHLFSVLSAILQILPHKRIRNSWHWNGLFCILNPSIWLYWVMLHSGNAIQIWANEFCFKDLGLRFWGKSCTPAVLLEVSGHPDTWKKWRLFSTGSAKTQLLLNKAPERKSQQIQWCWNLSETAILKPVLWHPTVPSYI